MTYDIYRQSGLNDKRITLVNRFLDAADSLVIEEFNYWMDSFHNRRKSLIATAISLNLDVLL